MKNNYSFKKAIALYNQIKDQILTVVNVEFYTLRSQIEKSLKYSVSDNLILLPKRNKKIYTKFHS